MATEALRTYRDTMTPGLARWIAVGAVAGAVSVLVFHQSLILLMNLLDLTHRPVYSMRPTWPFEVPQVWSLTFWGAVWGAALAPMVTRLEKGRLVLAMAVLGMALPTLVAWFVVAPLKGLPVAAGFALPAMLFSLLVNGAWGLGTGLGLALFGGRVERRRARADRRRAIRRREVQAPPASLASRW